MTSSSLCTILLATLLATVTANELARGWGETIAWTDLENGLNDAQTMDKPLMLIIHKSWCGACKTLKPKFAGSAEIAELSDKFVMVNALDEEEPEDLKYAPDGGYIPRIFFLNPNGEIISDIYNEAGSAEYKYYYPTTDSIVSSMKKVVKGRGLSDIKEDL